MFIVLIVFGLFTALIGFSIFFPARNALKREQEREAWPTVKGTVLSAPVVQPAPVGARRGKEKEFYDVMVNYQFRAEGQMHFGSAVSFRRALYEKPEAEQMAQRYPAGSTVTVHYSPGEPQECYLEMKPTPVGRQYRLSILFIAVAVIFVCLGLVLAWMTSG
jgi:hypothetical protein